MISKREIVLNTPKMNDLLSNAAKSEDQGISLQSDEYTAIGCDLRNLKRLERILKSVVDIDQCLVLCVAEVSITYMSCEDSNALISWTTSLSPGMKSTGPL
jgi:tRNA wybutosine-synthesizing protein 4